MNGRDRILMALAGVEPDQVPRALNFYHVEFGTLLPSGQSQDGLVDVDFVQFPPSPEEEELRRTAEPYPPNTRLGTPAQVTTYTRWQYRPQNPEHNNPLALARSLDDLRNFPFPDVHVPYQAEGLAHQVARVARTWPGRWRQSASPGGRII